MRWLLLLALAGCIEPGPCEWPLVQLLEGKGLLTVGEASDAREASESPFGVNVNGITGVVLNALMRNRTITRADAEDVIEKATSSGGILVDGYNPVLLRVGILEVLLTRGEITKAQGQAVADCACKESRDAFASFATAD